MSRHLASDNFGSIQYDIKHLPTEEVERIYGININTDGTVYDAAYDKTFNSLQEWMNFEADLDDMEYSEEYGHGKQEYDDYY